jgi:hypothetical protein
MINHISPALGNQSEVLAPYLITQGAGATFPSKKAEEFLASGPFRMGSVDQYFSTVELAGLRFGMCEARAVSCGQQEHSRTRGVKIARLTDIPAKQPHLKRPWVAWPGSRRIMRDRLC